MKKNLVLVVLLTFILSILTVGCQNAAQRPLNPNQNNTNQNNMTDTTLTDTELRALAERLEDLAEGVRGVDDAYVIISDMGDISTTDNNTGFRNNAGAGNNNVRPATPNPGLGTGTGDNNMGNTGLRNNNRNDTINNGTTRDNIGNNNTVGDTDTRDNRVNDNIGNPNPNMNGTTDRTDTMDRTDRTNNGLTGITENITNRFINFNNNTTNNATTNAQRLVVMVGIELEDNYKNNASTADSIQREVADKIKASDNRISQVYVTTDESMVKRIEDIADDVEDGGGALRTLRNEINRIYRDLVNQGPAF